MPITDIAWVLEEVKDYCDHAGIACTFYPMHEVLHHPKAAEVLDLFKNHSSDTRFKLITTDGVSLARRDDMTRLSTIRVRTRISS